MRIKIFHLLFLFFLCTGCYNHIQEKAILLNKEIAETPISSAKFDSLVQVVHQLPIPQRIECIIQIADRKEKTDGIFKQEKLLLGILSNAPKNKRKIILLRLIAIYDKLDRYNLSITVKKGLRYIEELENNFSLTQEEKWSLNKSRAHFLDNQGKQEEYLPIWFKLLKEHRNANRSDYIIEDLYSIAARFEKLGDNENAIALYKEAYQLSIDKEKDSLLNKCLFPLTLLLCENKKYQEAIGYLEDFEQNSTIFLSSPVYTILARCYLGINRPDIARSLLRKKLAVSSHFKILLNQQIAETYILEEKEDSASLSLNQVLYAFHNPTSHYQKKNRNTSLPTNFLHTYTMYAELLQKNSKIKQAEESYHLIEPLMYTEVQTPKWKEIQINAITSYSNFCRSTKQYAKALDLLAHRDSLQHVYMKMKEEQEKTNLVHRFEVGELTHKIEMQDVELKHSKTLNIVLLCAGIVSILLLTMIGLLFRERKKQFLKLYQQYEQLHKLDESPVIQQESPDPSKALFLRVEKKVREDKLFLRNDLTVEMLADLLNSNRTYISTSINEYMNKSFSTWINDIRIKYAVKLMHDDTTLDTKKLAQQCGFTTNETFYKNFKQRCGVKPNQYLDQIILEQEKK